MTHFVAGLGTSGTFMGTGRRLREFNPAIRLIAMQPDSPLHGLEGSKHMASAIVPGIYDPTLADERSPRSTPRTPTRWSSGWRARKGLLVGVSAAANVVAALASPRRWTSGTVVTIFCDGAAKYLSEPFWDED